MSLSSLAEAGALAPRGTAQARVDLAGRCIVASFVRSALASTAMVVVLALLAGPLGPYTSVGSDLERLIGVLAAVGVGRRGLPAGGAGPAVAGGASYRCVGG